MAINSGLSEASLNVGRQASRLWRRASYPKGGNLDTGEESPFCHLPPASTALGRSFQFV